MDVKLQSNPEQCIVFSRPVVMIILILFLLLVFLWFVLIASLIFGSLLNWMIFRLFVDKLILGLFVFLESIRNIFLVWQSEILFFFFIFSVKWLFTEWTFPGFEVGFFFEYFCIQRMFRCDFLLFFILVRLGRVWRGEFVILRDVVRQIDFEGDFIEFREFLFRRASCQYIVQKHYSFVHFILLFL